jgi:2-aminoethylphosphonate-pyruvate transaminase
VTTESPPGPRQFVLMNPGPVNVDAAVREALGRPDLCHREPEFRALMSRVRRKVTLTCGGGPEHGSVVLSGSGTAALEAAITSAVPHDGGLLVVDNGHYGRRIADIAALHGIRSRRLDMGWGTPVDLDLLDQTCAGDLSLSHVAVVHHETSTGMLNDVAAVAAVTRAHRCRVVVDAISSVGAEDLDVARDRIDWLVGTANKCLEGMPGLSFVCATHADFVGLSIQRPRTYYLDLHRHYQAQEKAEVPAFTPAVPLFYAFEAALDLALAEGVAPRRARYWALAERLREGLTELGLRLLLAPEERAVSLTAVALPDGVSYESVHRAMKSHGFVIYAAQEQLAQGYFRLSTMGTMDRHDIDRFLVALGMFLANPDGGTL